jgi:hypothetical protein
MLRGSNIDYSTLPYSHVDQNMLHDSRIHCSMSLSHNIFDNCILHYSHMDQSVLHDSNMDRRICIV